MDWENGREEARATAVRGEKLFKARRPGKNPEDARMMNIYRFLFQNAANSPVDVLVVEREEKRIGGDDGAEKLRRRNSWSGLFHSAANLGTRSSPTTFHWPGKCLEIAVAGLLCWYLRSISSLKRSGLSSVARRLLLSVFAAPLKFGIGGVPSLHFEMAMRARKKIHAPRRVSLFQLCLVLLVACCRCFQLHRAVILPQILLIA